MADSADGSSTNVVNNNTTDDPATWKGPVGEIEFQVSQVIGRLEEAVIRKTVAGESSDASNYQLNGSAVPLKCSAAVLQRLEDLLLLDADADSGFAALPELCELSRLSVLSHAIAAYAGSMERTHVARIATRISKDAAGWVSELFNRQRMAVCYHDDQLSGLVRVVRAFLHVKFNRYRDQGFDVFKNSLPVIYTNESAPAGIVQYVCKQLGLPLASINAIPSSASSDSQKMDLNALEREIELDKAKNKIPLVVLADAGTHIFGHVDDVARLREICLAHGAWLHLRGHSLASLSVTRTIENTSRSSESITLPLGIWLGVPGLPTVTVYSETLAPFMMDSPGRKLIALPVWTAFQCLGLDEIKKRFRDSFESCHLLWRRIEKYPNVRLLSQSPGGDGGNVTVNELTTRPVDIIVLLSVVVSTVVFQFVPENFEGRVPPYYDKLNSWFGQMLQRDCPLVNVTLCEVDNGEIVLRYCPFEPQPGCQQRPDFNVFVACFEQQVDILTATVKHKVEFQRLVEASKCLRVVEIDGWVGLGGVRYQPDALPDDQLTDHAKELLNNLNVSLVERLRSTDAAFSLGEGSDGLACVRFGMVTGDTDVGELLSLVETAGHEEEESGKVLDTMAEVVKRGIEAVTMELQRESDEQLWQEGILRSVPVVGSLVNWFSPHSKSVGIKGRSLDLTAGIVASTENIYRYHMQSSPSRQPLEQTSVTKGHSSSSSASSQQHPQHS